MSFLSALSGVLTGAVVTAVVGYSLVRFFMADLSKPEKVAWSFATGLLVQSILFLVAVSVLSGRVLFPLLLADSGFVGASFVVRPPERVHWRWGQARILAISLLAIAAIGWLVFLVSALSEPMWSTDYLAIWGLKSKTIVATGEVPRRLFADPELYWAHREYPLLVPISLAMLSSFTGGWDDQALALLFPLCELATLVALYGFLSRRVSTLAGASAAALTAVCFPLYHAGNAGTAEIPFAFSLVLVSTAFLDSLSDRSPTVAACLAVASLFCVSIKQEGTLLVLLMTAAAWLRRRWRPGGALALPALVHWLLLFVLRGPQTARDFELTLLEPRRWDELAPRLMTVIGRIAGTQLLAALVPLLAVLLFFLLTRRSLADALLPVLFLQLLVYIASFSLSSFDAIWAIGVFPRLAMSLFPALTLVLGARFAPPAEIRV